MIRLATYAWKYLRLTWRAARIWGAESDVTRNDEFLTSHYPKEWAELQEIRKSLTGVWSRDP